MSNGYLSSQINELKFTQQTKLQPTALWFRLSAFPEAALNKQNGKILSQMLSQVIFMTHPVSTCMAVLALLGGYFLIRAGLVTHSWLLGLAELVAELLAHMGVFLLWGGGYFLWHT